jgi:hypothetical protein
MKTFKQYYKTCIQTQLVDDLFETFGVIAGLKILHNTRTTMLLEAVDYTKPDPGAEHKPRDSRMSLIGVLAYLYNQISKESDPDKKASLQNKYKNTFKHANKRYGITQADIDSHNNHSGPGPSSDEPGSTAGGSKSYTGYEHGTYDSDNSYSKEDAERNAKDMSDWFDNLNQQTAQKGADKYGVPVEVWRVYNEIIRGYEGLQVPKTNSTSRGGFFDQMDAMGRQLDQMAFDKWIDMYKKSAEGWITQNKPEEPPAISRHIMTGKELSQAWDWFSANYEGTNGDKFNGHVPEHRQALPLAGTRTAEWRDKQHTSPPPGSAPEEEPEPDRGENPEPETQPGDDRQPSDEETSILNDIHRLLKRGKAAGGRIRNYLPLSGVYDPSEDGRDPQIADDTETLLDLVNMFRTLGKVMSKNK